jgi:predicted Rossmann fold nucleotide-binding protein DprA/Smf involved in DNA uptake
MTDQPIHSLTIALFEIKRVGPRTVEKLMPLLLKHYITTLKDAFELAKAHDVRLPEVGASERQAAEDTALRILETCHEQGTTYLHRRSREFPQALRNIPDAPVHLFVKGNSALIGSCSGRDPLAKRFQQANGPHHCSAAGAVWLLCCQWACRGL